MYQQSQQTTCRWVLHRALTFSFPCFLLVAFGLMPSGIYSANLCSKSYLLISSDNQNRCLMLLELVPWCSSDSWASDGSGQDPALPRALECRGSGEGENSQPLDVQHMLHFDGIIEQNKFWPQRWRGLRRLIRLHPVLHLRCEFERTRTSWG